MADNIVSDTQQKIIENVATDAVDGGDVYGDLGDPAGNMKLPSVDEIWKLIEQMDGISDEERASIRENLYNPQDGSAEDFLKRMGAQHTGVVHSRSDYIIFFAMIALIVLVFALFGYKLYKSLMEKELKKQEKQKQKQSKKTKKAN